MVAIGGWGDTAGFSVAAATESSRKLFAQNVKLMIDATGADGEDVVFVRMTSFLTPRLRGRH